MSKKLFDLHIAPKDWHYVKEEGMPRDFEYCYVIWKSLAGAYFDFFGVYNARKKEFSCGRVVLDADLVEAWALLTSNLITVTEPFILKEELSEK